MTPPRRGDLVRFSAKLEHTLCSLGEDLLGDLDGGHGFRPAGFAQLPDRVVLARRRDQADVCDLGVRSGQGAISRST